LPAAGFDDCEHRLIPSCSIPASEQVRVGFFFSRYGFDLCAIGERSPQRPRKNKRREKIPRRVAGLIACGRLKSRQSATKTRQT
jgi:hypothetical protein